MKINPALKIRSIAGESVVILQHQGANDMTKLITLNESAEFLWKTFEGKEFELKDVEAALISEYGINEELAARDAQSWTDKLRAFEVFI